VKIFSLYRGLGWPVTIVVKPEDATAYKDLLREYPQVEWIPEVGGQDTAHTVLAGWFKMAVKPFCLWVHPVDLPLVKKETIDFLSAESIKSPNTIIRPMYQTQPGHPVMMPAICLDVLEKQYSGLSWPSGSVRSMVKDAVEKDLIDPVLKIAVSDEAVIRDFDSFEEVNKGIQFTKGGPRP